MNEMIERKPSVQIPAQLPRREQLVCRVLTWVSLFLAIALPALVAYSLIGGRGFTDTAKQWPQVAAHFDWATLPWYNAALASVIAMLPALSMSRALWLASRCFRDFAAGHYFFQRNAQRLRELAGWLLTAAVLGLLTTPALSYILASGRGGAGAIQVSISSQQILMLVFTGLVWQISRIFAKAVALAEENAQFV
jgi:Protein of unknown function (DUF2975)